MWKVFKDSETAMIDGHGDDIWRYGDKVRYNFSTNIHAAFDHSSLMERLMECQGVVTSYPEPVPVSVEKAVARLHGCDSAEVMVTNGATESIYLIARGYAGIKSVIIIPTFKEYQDACVMHGHDVVVVTGLDMIPDDAGMVWLCNPNNPTGRVVPREALLRIVKDNSDKIFVIDQAYGEYTTLPVLSAEDAVSAGNVVLLGSLTKRFAVPGLRIGYSIGAGDLMDNIRKWRMPWSVNGLAIAGALYLLEHISDYNIDASSLHAEALRISDEFMDMGIRVTPTDCNFLLCELPHGNAHDLKRSLVEKSGILIRDASNFEGLDSRFFRVAAQSHEENDILIKEVGLWLHT